MKIAIFYHIGQIGLGALIYQQQLHRLYCSGLIKNANYIHFGINGDKELFNVPNNVIIKRNNNWKEETDTLLSLRDFCKENKDYKILYLHTKGVTKNSIQVNAWRLYLEYQVIDRWRECIEYLDTYDCCGPDYYPRGATIWSDGSMTYPEEKTTFFSGNFWWANSSYINTLKDDCLLSSYRLDRELWIGSNPNCRGKSLHNSDNKNLYEELYSENLYV